MRMEKIDGITLAGNGGTAEMQPGGLHLMLYEFDEPLQVGNEIALTLHFDSAPDQNIRADIKPLNYRPEDGDMKEGMHMHDGDHDHHQH